MNFMLRPFSIRIGNRFKHASHLARQFRTRFLVRPARKSIYFFTLHKCASTLFSSYVLRSLDELTHVDYAKALASGRRSPERALTFHEKGIVYGPIRLSNEPDNLVSRRLIEPVCRPDFLADKQAVFFVRDPRDILVSAYYSFGYTHGLSPVDELRERQIKERLRIQAISIDDYALSRVDQQAEWFLAMLDAADRCEQSVLLRYEEMIEDFETFLNKARRLLPISDDVASEMHRRSRPKKKEDQNSHRRSGKPGGFRSKLQPETIALLNDRLSTVLERFDYQS